MVVLQESIVVNRSVADCYRYLIDFSTVEQWDPGVASAQKVTPGAVKVGTCFDVQLAIGLASVPIKAPITVPMKYELLSATTNEELVLLGKADQFCAKDTISFEVMADEKTRINYRAELTFEAPVSKADALLAPALKRVGKAAVKGLKQALEIKSKTPSESTVGWLMHKAVVPAAATFTKLGYDLMKDKSHSQFMDGKRVVITGATSGIGLSCASELSRLGANIVIVGRNKEKLRKAKDQVLNYSGMAASSLKVVEADLSLMSDVRKAAAKLNKVGKIDVLINNAGALFNERALTEEGYEQSVALNLMSPWLLVESLMEKICADKAHVITMSSGGMYLQSLRLDDMEFARGKYNGSRAYARAKRALIDLTDYWARTHGGSGARFNTMHPGWAQTPGVSSSLPAFEKTLDGQLRTAAQGADTAVWLASSQSTENVSGQFWFDRKPRTTQVIPGTASNSKEIEGLLQWLRLHAPVGEKVELKAA